MYKKVLNALTDERVKDELKTKSYWINTLVSFGAITKADADACEDAIAARYAHFYTPNIEKSGLWYENACKAAQNRLEINPYSRERLLYCLINYDHYTEKQAEYAVSVLERQFEK